jgi:hypothetical protein
MNILQKLNISKPSLTKPLVVPSSQYLDHIFEEAGEEQAQEKAKEKLNQRTEGELFLLGPQSGESNEMVDFCGKIAEKKFKENRDQIAEEFCISQRDQKFYQRKEENLILLGTQSRGEFKEMAEKKFKENRSLIAEENSFGERQWEKNVEIMRNNKDKNELKATGWDDYRENENKRIKLLEHSTRGEESRVKVFGEQIQGKKRLSGGFRELSVIKEKEQRSFLEQSEIGKVIKKKKFVNILILYLIIKYFGPKIYKSICFKI